MQHRELRSNMIMSGRKTSPKPPERPQDETTTYPVHPKPLSGELQPRTKGGREASRKLSARSFQASFFRQAQVRTESTHLGAACPLVSKPVLQQAWLRKPLRSHSLLRGRPAQAKLPRSTPLLGRHSLTLISLSKPCLRCKGCKRW